MSSPDSLPRDTDFGYEVIDEDDKKESGEQADDDASSVSVADHYRGTPPLRGKKKKPPHRNEKNADPVSEFVCLCTNKELRMEHLCIQAFGTLDFVITRSLHKISLE